MPGWWSRLLGGLRRHAPLLVWTVYFVIPTDAGGWVDGIPIGPLETLALIALAWLTVRKEAPSLAWVVGLVLAVSVTGGALIPGSGGFRARYFANAAATGPPERSTEHRDASFTRIDEQLHFAMGGPEFPLAFFNDIERFNFHDPAGPRRRLLEFAAAWTGQWWVEAGDRTLYLEAPDATARLFVDGAAVAEVTPDSDRAQRTVTLGAGWHRLDVAFSSPYGGPRRFSAGELRDGTPRPFNAATVSTQRVRPWQVTAASWLRLVKSGCDIAALGWLAWLFAASFLRYLTELARNPAGWAQRSQVLPVVVVIGVVEALVHAWPWSRQFMVMAGGDDPMTYEWYSRDILLNGILMNGGAPLGTGETFYYQALYPYFLAAAHALFGEGMFGVLLIQRLLVILAVVMMVRIAVALAGEAAWPGALAAGVVFAIWKYAPIAAQLLNESLYVPMLLAWTAAVLHLAQAPSVGRALGTGGIGAIAAMTRSTALSAWPAVFASCWWAWRSTRNWRAPLCALILSSLAVFSLIAVRNALVAGEFALTSSELGVTLLGGNEPPAGLVIDRGRAAQYERLGLDPFTAQVVEYAIAAPGSFALHQGRKALFALGIYEPYAPGWGYSPVYVAGWMLAAAGLVAALRARRLSPVLIAVPAMIAATQFLSVVVVYPKSERLILPIYALLVPYAGIALSAAAATLRRHAGGRLGVRAT